MRILPLLIALLLAVPALADVYRWTDKDGVIHYTDTPPVPGAKPVELPALQTFKPDAPPPLLAPVDPAAAGPVKPTIVITAPAAEDTIRDAEGKVPVSVTATMNSGDGIIYLLDGTPQNAKPTPSTALLLSGIERGEHHVGALLVDATGKTLATAAPVTVYLMPPTVRR
jgi:hypothetical protein